MRSWLTLIFIPLFVFAFTGCGGKDEGSSIRQGRCERGCTGSSGGGGNYDDPYYDGSSGSYSEWGQIYKDQYTQSQFQDGVDGFVSATIDPWGDYHPEGWDELGDVSGDIDQDTGVWIRGKAVLRNGSLNPNGSNNSQIEPGQTALRMVIWDTYAGQTDAQGNTIPEYGVSFDSAESGYVNGNTAVIRFRDGKGWVELNGVFDSQWFYGEVKFDNAVGAYNISPKEGRIGYFFLPTCGFFRCN